MSRPGPNLRETMAALAHEALRGTEHPSTNQLIAYQRGELPAVEVAAIREHLSLCEECAALVLEAAEFFADEEEEEANPADLEAAWEELRAAIPGKKERPPSPLPVPPPPPIQRHSLLRSLSFAYGLAAIFALASIGLLLFHEWRPALRPQVNAGLYDLTPTGSERGFGAPPTLIRFRSRDDSALLILNPAVAANSARYGVRIRREDGAVLWRSEGLELLAPGAFHLTLPAGALPPGRYSLELYGITEVRQRPLGTYRIAIER